MVFKVPLLFSVFIIIHMLNKINKETHISVNDL